MRPSIEMKRNHAGYIVESPIGSALRSSSAVVKRSRMKYLLSATIMACVYVFCALSSFSESDISSRKNSSSGNVKKVSTLGEYDWAIRMAPPPLTPPIPVNSSDACSCWNSSMIAGRCCQRQIIRIHKMGFMASTDYYRQGRNHVDLVPTDPRNQTYPQPRVFGKVSYPSIGSGSVSPLPPSPISIKVNGEEKLVPIHDYRHIFVVRDFFDSIVSGYLYHRSGRECWLDPDGKPWAYADGTPMSDSHNSGGGWDQASQDWVLEVLDAVLRYSGIEPPESILRGYSSIEEAASAVIRPDPAGRTICQYLAEESERDGLRAVMFVAMLGWWSSLLERVNSLSKKQEDAFDDQGRTIFVCYESMTDSLYELATLQTMTRHFYPSGDVAWNGTLKTLHEATTSPEIPANSTTPQVAAILPAKHHLRRRRLLSTYAGGHATEKDPTVRQRLLDLAMEMDRDDPYFQGWIAQANAQIGCKRKAAEYPPVATNPAAFKKVAKGM